MWANAQRDGHPAEYRWRPLFYTMSLPRVLTIWWSSAHKAAEICWRVWGTPANFKRFRVFAALLPGTVVVGVSQTLQHWTEGATYILQGGHHVGHWPTFLVDNSLIVTVCAEMDYLHFFHTDANLLKNQLKAFGVSASIRHIPAPLCFQKKISEHSNYS